MNWNKLFSSRDFTTLKETKEYVQKYVGDIDFKIINVVGTNGKGSVSSYISQGLTNCGKKVGLFTSPHLVRPTERIKINNKEIDEKEIEELSKDLPKMHFFTFMFLVALRWFKKQKVEVAILEAGIGGLLDTTNAVKGDYGIVTSVGMDHKDILGYTKEEIAKQKAGIINQGMKFYIPNTIDKELAEYFIKQADEPIGIDIKSKDYRKINSEIASYVLEDAFNIHKSKFKDPKGRLDIVKRDNKTFILDVAHNDEGIKALFDALLTNNINYDNIVFAIQKTKDITVLGGVLPKNKKVFFTRPSDLFRNFKKYKYIIDPLSLKGTTLLFGSFYFIGGIYEKLDK